MKWFLMLLFMWSVHCESQQKFYYQATDLVQIESNGILQLSLSLMTEANQYLSQANILITMNITQNTSLLFNLLYFNYQQQAGQLCYQNYINTQTIPQTYPCSDVNNNLAIILPPCMNYTNCNQQHISLSVELSQQFYKQNYVIIENNNKDEQLKLSTSVKMQLSSQNTWFYWGVGLTCLLLINLVILTGIVFYWTLKYKKVKKMFEQFKLTEQSQTLKVQ